MRSTRRSLFRDLLGAALLAVTARVMPWEAEAVVTQEPPHTLLRWSASVDGAGLVTIMANVDGEWLTLRDGEVAVYRSGRWVVEGRGDA